MGALIQTKGTQRLAHLFNNRFDAGSIGRTRDVQNSSGTPLKTAFFQIPSSRNMRPPPIGSRTGEMSSIRQLH